MIGRATNGQECNRFIKQISTKISDKFNVKPHLLLDGHPAHFTRENRALIDQNF